MARRNLIECQCLGCHGRVGLLTARLDRPGGKKQWGCPFCKARHITTNRNGVLHTQRAKPSQRNERPFVRIITAVVLASVALLIFVLLHNMVPHLHDHTPVSVATWIEVLVMLVLCGDIIVHCFGDLSDKLACIYEQIVLPSRSQNASSNQHGDFGVKFRNVASTLVVAAMASCLMIALFDRNVNLQGANQPAGVDHAHPRQPKLPLGFGPR